MHRRLPLLITRTIPVALHLPEDIATYLSRSRSSSVRNMPEKIYVDGSTVLAQALKTQVCSDEIVAVLTSSVPICFAYD